MPIHVSWANEEHTILLETFEGKWTVDDYTYVIDTGRNMIKQVPHTVHIVVDGLRSGRVPPEMVSNIRYGMSQFPPNMGVVVFVGLPAFAQALLNVAQVIAPHIGPKLLLADTLEDAYRLIEQHEKPSP